MRAHHVKSVSFDVSSEAVQEAVADLLLRAADGLTPREALEAACIAFVTLVAGFGVEREAAHRNVNAYLDRALELEPNAPMPGGFQ